MSSLTNLIGGNGSEMPFFNEYEYDNYIAGKYYLPTINFDLIGTSSAPVSNMTYYSPFVCKKTHTFTGISVFGGNSTEGSTTFNLGIYNDTNGLPNTRLLDAGSIAFANQALTEITISQQLVHDTLYWLALGISGTAVRVYTASTLHSPLLSTMGFSLFRIGIGLVKIIGSSAGSTITSIADPDMVAGFNPLIYLKG